MSEDNKEDDGTVVTLGDRVEITEDNVETFREVLGDPVADAIKELSDKSHGVYEVVKIGMINGEKETQ